MPITFLGTSFSLHITPTCPTNTQEHRELVDDDRLVHRIDVRPRHHQHANAVLHQLAAHQRQQQAVALARDLPVHHDRLYASRRAASHTGRLLEEDLQVADGR